MIKALSASAIMAMFKSVGHCQNADGHYDLPSLNWLLDYCIKWVSQRAPWTEKFDCDDFAFAFKVACQEAHRKGSGLSDGLAVGVIFYRPDRGGGHAINFAVVGDNEVVFIEPQTGERLCLTKSELESVFFVYL